MRYYILDDEIGVVKALENIIENRIGGQIAGSETNPNAAMGEIIEIRPDILLVDFLMAELDGVSVVRNLKSKIPQMSFIMITKVSDKDMVAQAYKAGVEFLIQKPLNLIEIESVLKRVEEHRRMNEIVSNIKCVFEQSGSKSDISKNTDGVLHEKNKKKETDTENVKYLLTMLGMNGEKGTSDILKICQHILESGCTYSPDAAKHIADECKEPIKNVEQRIRRAIKKGLSNVANAGIEDYSGDVFQIYASYVFDFTTLKEEMNFKKGISSTGGRVNISKFIDGLIFYNQICTRD